MMTTTQNNSQLTNAEIQRYSRQLLIPDFGIDAQVKLKSKSALVIGCGGLGCPAALYLCTSGLGTLGLLDVDTIELSNIQRQVAHGWQAVGKSKARNLTARCQELNELVNYVTHETLFDKSVALELVSKYDVVLDCTDNVITRYLINDACVLLGKPLVSGSALKFEGQLTVYNHGAAGPCYRCLYAKAPPPETVSNCSDAGIMGPVVGTIGSLQALEAIKVLTERGTPLAGRMLLFDGLDMQTRVVKLRARQSDTCVMCREGKQESSEQAARILQRFDYELFCGGANYHDKATALKLLDENAERVTCAKYNEICQRQEPHLLVDVRPETQFKICALPNSLNIPIELFLYEKETALKRVENELKSSKSIYVVCRRGNDSQLVVRDLCNYFNKQEAGGGEGDLHEIKDIIGGLQAWSNTIDKQFPLY